MEFSIENSAVSAAARETRPDATQALIELLCFILGDADSDIGVVARELGLSDASSLWLRRARDRVACAQRLLETVREIAGGTAGWAGPPPAEAEGNVETIAAAMLPACDMPIYSERDYELVADMVGELTEQTRREGLGSWS